MDRAEPDLDDFPLRTWDKVRYRDTDRQGHVNNAVFSTFLETGRTELVYNPENPLFSSDTSFVIVKTNLDLKAEIHWPGTVEIGTRVKKIGNSSIELIQAIYQKGAICAFAETVLVHVDNATRKSKPLPWEIKDELQKYM